MSKELTIIIAGQANTGKSTMMLQIEKLLKENGFNVELSLKGHPDYTGENSYYFHQKEQKDFSEKIDVIKSETKIILKELQVSNAKEILQDKDQREFYTNC
jgi:Mg-chelatase subunit ChlI